MPPLLRIGEILRGRVGTYTITKELQEFVWLAKYAPAERLQSDGRLIFGRNYRAQETVVVKSVADHPRVENERDVLKRFQHRTHCLRPLIDEIVEPSAPVIIVLKYFQSDLLDASIKQTLNRKELKYVSRQILEALRSLHNDGYVHTGTSRPYHSSKVGTDKFQDLKPDNVFVNFQEGDIRFSDVRLGDLGGCYPADSDLATSGTAVGAPIWSSPEVILEMPWNTATDIWSFGVVVRTDQSHTPALVTNTFANQLISLIYGGNFNLFRPKGLKRDHEEYLLGVLTEQFRYFAPFPAKFEEIAGPETINSILYLMQVVPREKTTPFSQTTEQEVGKADREFIGKVMRLDWRDRPTAAELLADEWWAKD